jgi:hypothetical protein
LMVSFVFPAILIKQHSNKVFAYVFFNVHHIKVMCQLQRWPVRQFPQTNPSTPVLTFLILATRFALTATAPEMLVGTR